jgi:hypothetical protein
MLLKILVNMMIGMFDIYNVYGASEITKNDIYMGKI